MYDFGFGVPAGYDQINQYNSQVSPSTVHCTNTALSRYFQRYLLQKAMSLYKWEMPDTWAENYFLYVLYEWGFLAVFNTDKFGVIFQPCGLEGYDVFYQPTNAVISNPLISQILNPRIGKQCTIIKLQPDYGGLLDMVYYYADLMALCVESAGMNLVNSKLAYVFTGSNKNDIESFKKIFDQIAAGNPAVYQKRSLKNDDGSSNWEMFSQDLKNNFLVNDIFIALKNFENRFATDLGIPNSNTDKKERMTDDEVNSNNVDTMSRASMWLEGLQKQCKAARDMFGINLSVDWRFKPVLGGVVNGGNDDNVTDRTVQL